MFCSRGQSQFGVIMFIFLVFFRHKSVGVFTLIGGTNNISQHILVIDEPTFFKTENMFFNPFYVALN